jgi:tetratricopeptide (TPR) repeat protein
MPAADASSPELGRDWLTRVRVARSVLVLGIALFSALGIEARAATPAATQNRLRQLSRLPRLSFAVGVNFDSLNGFVMVGGRTPAPKVIAELREAMQGGVGDASRHARLARLYSEAGNDKEARLAAKRAVELFRKQAADQSGDGVMLADYGWVLQLTDQTEEAERVLRRAVVATPEDWRPHAALGGLLAAQAMMGVVPRSSSSPPTPVGLAEDIARAKPDPAQIEKARTTIKEALACYDRAVALTSTAPEPLAGRAAAHAGRSILDAVLESAGGSDTQDLRLLKAIYARDSLEDLREVARRSPKDPIALGTVALFEVLAASVERGISSLESLATGEAWNQLSDSTRRSARESLARLEELGQSPEAAVAGAALEVLGALQACVVRDLPGAEANLRRAVQIDPGRDQAWNNLIFLLATSKRPADLLTVCNDWLEHRESARARLLVAKALEQLDRWDQVVETTERLCRRYPDNLDANLALAAALVHTVEGDAALPRIVQLLSKSEKLLGNAPTHDQIKCLLFTRGLVFALAGVPERAREEFRQILEISKGDPEALEAIEVLEQVAAASKPE